LPSRLSYFSERLELSLRWSAPGRRTRRGLVIPTRRCTPGGTRGARLYAATGAACPAARTQDILARIVNGARRAPRTWTGSSPLPSPPPALPAPGSRFACPRFGPPNAGVAEAGLHGERAAGARVGVPSPPVHTGRGPRSPGDWRRGRGFEPSPPPVGVGSLPGPTFEGGPGVLSYRRGRAAAALTAEVPSA
jgi:hypothetical protein